MPAGRPTLYTPELVAQAREYLERDRSMAEQNDKSFREVIPSAVGLALELDIAETTMYRWGEESDKVEFKGILDAIQKKQHQILMNSGLSGAFNPAITKLILGKHGHHEKTEVESSIKLYAKQVDDMSDEELDAELSKGV